MMYYTSAMDTPRPGKTRVTSVSLQAETLEAIRTRAGKQGVSAYIEEAVQRQLQREAIDEYIAGAEAEHGPVDQAEVAARVERIRAHHSAHRSDATGADGA
jgi:post-segregation antitoxin (ccd killing protein)